MLLLQLAQISPSFSLSLFSSCYHVYFLPSFSGFRWAEESWDAPWQSSVSVLVLITGDHWSALNIEWWCWRRFGTSGSVTGRDGRLSPLGNNWTLLMQQPHGSSWTKKNEIEVTTNTFLCPLRWLTGNRVAWLWRHPYRGQIKCEGTSGCFFWSELYKCCEFIVYPVVHHHRFSAVKHIPLIHEENNCRTVPLSGFMCEFSFLRVWRVVCTVRRQ